MGRRNRNKAKLRRTRYDGSNNDREIMNTVHNQIQHDYYSNLVEEYESKQRRNKQLFEKAKSMVSKHFQDHTIRTYFGHIKLEILHLIPLHPELSPEIICLRVMEEGSVLLGRIDRCDRRDRKVYIRDIDDGEICFEYECSTDVVMPGRFIAIKNPKMKIFQDGKFGFRAEDEGCVLIIDVDGQQDGIIIFSLIVLVLCGLFVFYITK